MPAESLVKRVMADYADLRPQGFLARLFGIAPISDDMRPWYVGALGELEVGRMLGALPAEYTVFHSLPVGTGESDIDHLVVGPGGVFTINTKHHADKRVWVAGTTVMVSGQRQPYIRNSTHEAKRVTTLLRRSIPEAPAARAVVAIVAPRQIRVKSAPSEVTVLDAARLRRWLLKRPVVLTPEEVSRTVAALGVPELWRDEPAVEAATFERFGELRRAMRSARRVRLTWVLGLIGGWLIAVPAYGPAVISRVLSVVFGVPVG